MKQATVPDLEAKKRLNKFCSAAQKFRATVDRIFVLRLAKSRHARTYFLNLLISSSALSLSSLEVGKFLSNITFLAREGEDGLEHKAKRPSFDEQAFRARFRKHLIKRQCWNTFSPENPFSPTTSLRILDDYISSISLHIPEAYGESMHSEKLASILRSQLSERVTAELLVGLKHLTRNHLSFVHFALEWAADDSSWTD